MKLTINIIERLALLDIFGQFNLKTVAKLREQKQMIETLEITEDEKESINWQQKEGVNIGQGKVTFNIAKAKELTITITLKEWQEKVLRVCLEYSELLDSFNPNFLDIYDAIRG